MSKPFKTAIISIVTLTLLTAGIAFARQASCPQIERMDRIEGINLTDAQKETLNKNFNDQQRAMIQLRADMETAGMDVRELTRNTEFDKAAIKEAMDKMNQVRTQMRDLHLDTMEKTRSVLNDAQWELYVENANFHGKRFGGGDKGKRGCPGKGYRGAKGPGNCPGYKAGNCPGFSGAPAPESVENE